MGYVKSLGVTAVELLPIQSFISDNHLLEKGLSILGLQHDRFLRPRSQVRRRWERQPS